MKAFGIGKMESEAVVALMTKIPEATVERLCAAVRMRGMSRFLSHECIAKQVFNLGWSSGVLSCESWKDELTNKADHRLAARLHLPLFGSSIPFSCKTFGSLSTPVDCLRGKFLRCLTFQ